MNGSMTLNSNADAEPITFLSIRNKFKVTSNLNNEGKVQTLLIFIDITNGNIQGIVAERYNDTLMAAFIPPEMDGNTFSEGLLKTAINEWRF